MNATQQIDLIIESGTAKNTLRAHKGDARYFWGWAKEALGLAVEYPVAEKVVIKFVMDHLAGLDAELEARMVAKGIKATFGNHSPGTITRRVSTISYLHESQNLPNPCRGNSVRILLSKGRRAAIRSGHAPTKKKALIYEDLKRMLKTFDYSIIDYRDKAILLFAFASGGRRRSEVAAALYDDLTKIRGGYLYRLPKSKTDRAGAGQVKPILKSAGTALGAWLKKGKISKGFIFRRIQKTGTVTEYPISEKTVSDIVKRRVEIIGLDPDLYGAHSLRSGFMTEAGLRKAPLGEAMQLSGHASAQVALGYYQAGDVLRNPAAKMID